MTNKKTYNPKSKEFKEEAKKLGITGYRLMIKYQREGRCIDKSTCVKSTISTPRICCSDKSHNTYINSKGNECWRKHKCQKDTCTGYLCTNCYQKYDPNSSNNLIKSVANRRTGNLKNSYLILGDNCEKLTEILFGAERLSVKYDNYRLPVDHGPITKHITIMIGDKLVDLYGMIPQTKGNSYSLENDWSTKSEQDKEFDILIFYCLSEDGKIIERLYIISKEKLINISGIAIRKNPMSTRGPFPIISVYEQYRVNDEKILELANKKWEKIIKGD